MRSNRNSLGKPWSPRPNAAMAKRTFPAQSHGTANATPDSGDWNGANYGWNGFRYLHDYNGLTGLIRSVYVSAIKSSER